MKIIDVEISNVVSLYVVMCGCGTKFKSRTDRYRVECPGCKKTMLTRDIDGQDDEIRDSSTGFESPT
jgi:hypothetical protein